MRDGFFLHYVRFRARVACVTATKQLLSATPGAKQHARRGFTRRRLLQPLVISLPGDAPFIIRDVRFDDCKIEERFSARADPVRVAAVDRDGRRAPVDQGRAPLEHTRRGRAN